MQLIFAGCSFVTGQALCWQEVYGEPAPRILARDPRYAEYVRLRRPWTLAEKTAQLVGAGAVDISHDGMSNQAIAHRTIEWLERNGHEDRVVCVGWTEPIRRMVWDGFWINVSVNAFEDPQLPADFRDYIEKGIVSRPDEEHNLEYISSMYLLNSYLRSRAIPSVQWRSMGLEFAALAGLAQPEAMITGAWLGSPTGISWHQHMRPADYISPVNQHPNLEEVQRHAARLAEQIALLK